MCINDPCSINKREIFLEMKERRKIVIYQLEKEKRFSMPPGNNCQYFSQLEESFSN